MLFPNVISFPSLSRCRYAISQIKLRLSLSAAFCLLKSRSFPFLFVCFVGKWFSITFNVCVCRTFSPLFCHFSLHWHALGTGRGGPLISSPPQWEYINPPGMFTPPIAHTPIRGIGLRFLCFSIFRDAPVRAWFWIWIRISCFTCHRTGFPCQCVQFNWEACPKEEHVPKGFPCFPSFNTKNNPPV